MKKRILIIGSEDQKKLELMRLLENNRECRSIQSIQYGCETISVPGSYLRSSGMKKHIIAIQQNAYCVLMLLDSSRNYKIYSPNFAHSFRIPTIGVIIKCSEQSVDNTLECRKELQEAGVHDIVEWQEGVFDGDIQILNKIVQIKEGNR
ncbi:TPA: EutP/PduV family microcompartment system protein [Streptococcus suis]